MSLMEAPQYMIQLTGGLASFVNLRPLLSTAWHTWQPGLAPPITDSPTEALKMATMGEAATFIETVLHPARIEAMILPVPLVDPAPLLEVGSTVPWNQKGAMVAVADLTKISRRPTPASPNGHPPARSSASSRKRKRS
jgi:hypothetical protein